MKLWLVLASLFTIGVFASAQSDSSAGTHVDAAKVAAALAKGGPLVTRSDLLVQGSHREASGQVEVHDKETDVLYVVDGEATFKQFKADPARFVPCSTNPAHREIRIGSGQAFELLGRVIWKASRM